MKDRQTERESDRENKGRDKMKRGKRGARGKMASCAWWTLLRKACATQMMAERHLVMVMM